MTSNERRTFQRLKLAKPILGTMDGHSALILDIGVGGAFIEHHGRAMKDLKLRLAFRWQGSELVASALGGTLRLTGDPDRAPVKEALDACGFHADMVAASGVMAALFERETS